MKRQIVAVIWFAAAFRRGGESRESREQALKRRHANGETDLDTYEPKLSDLRK